MLGLRKCYSLGEQRAAQIDDERYCQYPEGKSWVRQMSAAWEIMDYPGLALSKEPPSKYDGPALWSFWMYGNSARQECQPAWKLCQALSGQAFTTRRGALQALEAATLIN